MWTMRGTLHHHKVSELAPNRAIQVPHSTKTQSKQKVLKETMLSEILNLTKTSKETFSLNIRANKVIHKEAKETSFNNQSNIVTRVAWSWSKVLKGQPKIFRKAIRRKLRTRAWAQHPTLINRWQSWTSTTNSKCSNKEKWQRKKREEIVVRSNQVVQTMQDLKGTTLRQERLHMAP